MLGDIHYDHTQDDECILSERQSDERAIRFIISCYLQDHDEMNFMLSEKVGINGVQQSHHAFVLNQDEAIRLRDFMVEKLAPQK